VTETIDLVARAGALGDRWAVLSLAPETFVGVPDARRVPGSAMARRAATVEVSGALAGALGLRLTRGRVATGDIARWISGARLLVGVGGGYLRAGGGHESVLTAAFHVPQLIAATSVDTPSIYLPQSVGPLRGVVGAAIRRLVPRLTWIGLRDDTSVEELGAPANAERMPDLGVLAVARKLGRADHGVRGGRVGLVVRKLDFPGFDERVLALAGAVNPVWGVHSEAQGQRDGDHLRDLGIVGTRPTSSLYDDPEIGVVVSARLHGAVQALFAGIPAIHLSYERKGFGAYDDLGLSRYGPHAARFVPDVVAAQCAEVLADPAVYWAAVKAALPDLDAADGRLVRRLADAAAR
jgi:hypothetical protein